MIVSALEAAGALGTRGTFACAPPAAVTTTRPTARMPVATAALTRAVAPCRFSMSVLIGRMGSELVPAAPHFEGTTRVGQRQPARRPVGNVSRVALRAGSGP